MALRNVKAFVFDVFGTVVDWRTGVAREAARFFERRKIADVDPFAFADAWRGRYQPSMEVVRSGGRGFVPLDLLHLENLEFVLSDLGIDPAGIPEAELEDLNFAWHRLDPWPDAVEGIKRLKAKFIVAPLSNGNVRLMVDMAKRAGIPWDAILGAEVARAYKPAPEAYFRAADMLGLTPEEVCMVAAHNSDLAAARACGMKTAFVPRPNEHGPGQTVDLEPEQDWDAVASSFTALASKAGA